VPSGAAAWTVTVLGLAVSVAGNIGHVAAPADAKDVTRLGPGRS
jgi:hypothetical protein